MKGATQIGVDTSSCHNHICTSRQCTATNTDTPHQTTARQSSLR